MIDGVRICVVVLACALGCAIAGGCSSGPTSRLTDAEEYSRDRTMRLVEAQRLAERAERADDPAEAEVLLREAVDLFPQHSAFWTNLGTSLALQDDYGSAAEAYGIAAELDPTDPRPSYNLGALYTKRFWPRPAQEHFEQALERDPNYLNAIRGLVHTRMRLQNYDRDLLELLDRAVLLERDERWLRYFQRQRNVVQAALGEEDGSADG